jgi:tetratricopeptide (TPR) repeat protein
MPITDAEFYFILGLQYSLEGNNKQAIDFFITDNALNLEPELENVYFFRALYFYKMKLHEVTIKDFTSAIEIDKHFGEAYLYRVFCKGMLDDLKGATFDMHRPLLS